MRDRKVLQARTLVTIGCTQSGGGQISQVAADLVPPGDAGRL
jgi:hypothetical protein